MCFPAAPKLPDRPAAPSKTDPNVVGAGARQRSRISAAAGQTSTLLTGSLGDVSAARTSKKKLGSGTASV